MVSSLFSQIHFFHNCKPLMQPRICLLFHNGSFWLCWHNKRTISVIEQSVLSAYFLTSLRELSCALVFKYVFPVPLRITCLSVKEGRHGLRESTSLREQSGAYYRCINLHYMLTEVYCLIAATAQLGLCALCVYFKG